MDPGRALLPNTPAQGSGVGSQARELQPLTEEIIDRRFCRFCTEYIERPPFMASRCCGHNYHYGCTVVMTREITPCSTCNIIMPVEFVRNVDFGEEVKKYDWSFFEPVLAQGGREPNRASDSGPASEQAGSIAAVSGVSGLSVTENQPVVGAEGGGESAHSQIYRSPLGPQELTSSEAPYPLLPTASRQSIVRPSQEIDVVRMTMGFERLLAQIFTPEELLALASASGSDYKFLREMMARGVVPKWQKICQKEGYLCGRQMDIDKPEGAHVFFTAMQQHLDQLEPDHPFFVTFACLRQNPVTGYPEPVSPVVRIFRHQPEPTESTKPGLIFLFTFSEQLSSRFLGRLGFGSFASGTQLVKYLQFLMLTNGATQAIFVRPTLDGESDAEGLDSIDVKAFVQQYPPRDFGEGIPSKNDRGILLAAARSLGLQRIRKEDAEKVVLLSNMIEGGLRNSQLTVKHVIARMSELGYCQEQEKILFLRTRVGQMPGLPMSEAELGVQMSRLQHQVVNALTEMYEARATNQTDYILMDFESGLSVDPQKILMLVCDTDRLYLVNMKDRSVSTQCSSSIADICDFCKVFMSGYQVHKAHITSFVPTQTPENPSE
ncbi:hypothetical protein J7438_11585 [Thalassotalea sp. G20_0]|uniref:hypothetical protein n=1 Tax=Thalassotalea sp. G20_0 TaxID=2821093 RepID=UPI001ADA60DD|nr:hypothetical protein [Thalassotalea sp. G20_0]MBO9494730.1 hypothetical protein [Thalassotalea sp. G20_0]